MSEHNWPEIKTIVADALERPESERALFVGQRCAGRPDLLKEVESLLAAHVHAGPFMDEPFAPALAGDFKDDHRAGLAPGTEIGTYRILKEIGRGGMGAVYLAERADSTFEKHVAIKIVAGHIAAPDLVRRFLEERRILATLDHPNIARLLDAGATAEGLPYVVMEYVDGSTINVHCQDRQLPIRQRLAMFRLVCDAVHHAHQRLIVHRDIKAANILVAADGTPKLLDFGIAKLVEEGRAPTETAVRAFTPESASPEQMGSDPVTVTSDVYSLGVLLYRLLTDRKIFDFSSSSEDEIRRTIRERDPVPPSEAAAGSARHGERVSRELDWITLKALRKEPGRRYASVLQLSEDCERYLHGKPVLAGPDTFRYRTTKFLRRHWMGSAAAAAIVLLILVTGTAIWYQRQRAERRFNDVRTLANTLVGELYDAIAEVPGTTSARQLLVTRALSYLDALSREAGNDTSLKLDLADAYQKIGDVQGNPYGANLGDVPGARESYRKLVDLRAAVHEANGGERQSALALGRAHARIGDLDLAQGTYAQAVESYQRALALLDAGPSGANGDAIEDLARVQGRRGVALTWSGRRAEARESLLESIRLLEQLSDRPGASRVMRRGLAVNHANLGDVYHYDGDFVRALESHQRAVDIARALQKEAPDDITPKRDVVLMLARVAGDYIELGRHTDSIPVTEESIAVYDELVKADPQNVQFQFDLADLYGNLAVSQRETRQLDSALQSIERSIQISERAAARNPEFKAHRFNFAGALRQLGLVHRDRGFTTLAIQAFRRSIEVFDSLPADQRDPTQSIAATAELGQALALEGSRSQSPALLREARTRLQQALDGWKGYKGSAAAEQQRQIDILGAALADVDRRLSR